MNKDIKEFSRQPRFMPEMPVGQMEVPNPPSKSEKPEISWFAMLIPPAVMLIITVLIALNSKSMYMMLSIVMTIMTVIGSLVATSNQLKKYKRHKKEREKRYLQLITDIRTELTLSKQKQIVAMNEMSPEPLVCVQRIKNTDSKLWERTPAYKDFLSLRMGIGNTKSGIDIVYSKKQLTLEDDPLADEPERIFLEFNTISNVPVCLNLFESEICGIVGEDSKVQQLLNLLMLQIITHHGYDDVKVVLILKDNSLSNWDWVRHIPHIWDNEYLSRYILCGKAMTHQTLSELNDILKSRELKAKNPDQYSDNLPHYIFIVEDRSLLENEGISKYLYSGNKSIGVSTLFIAQNIAYLPTNCKAVVSVGDKNGEYANHEKSEKSLFIVDTLEARVLSNVILNLSPVRVKSSSANFSLPKSITLMQMLHVTKAEDVDLLSYWKKHKTYMGMNVPIGARAGGEAFNLDIHETGFGPHGLVAGTTGSGKSELLQSIIISLAINYHPHDLVFVLIDYKGGGMADVFKGMPHLVGTITNLGGNQTTRALLSIKSELQSRQRIFSKYEVNNIDKYQKLYYSGKNDNTMPAVPHLIMIADEFAELKQEQPDFMKELVSAARVGRSLGVHLILATQKPAGVVDDQIWSNSKFKICLKVQDEADSRDVIKRPDAAMIKEPGRAYIQVGNDEVFEMFQSAFSGADYDPDGHLQLSRNKSKYIYKVKLNGKTDKIFPLEEEKIAKKEMMSQLKKMVDCIIKTAEENEIEAIKGPWLPPLESILYSNEVKPNQYSNFDEVNNIWTKDSELLRAKIGIADNPRAQIQAPVEINFAKDGNLIIYGSAGTGKTVLLKSICISLANLYSPKDVNIYIMDFGGSAFKQFESLPHCGGVMTLEQEAKIIQFILYLFRVVEERKNIFEASKCDNFNAYKKNHNDLPPIVLIIDNYFALSETYEEIDDKMIVLAREGIKYGIYLVTTASNANMIKYKFSINFKMAIALTLTEAGEYDAIVGRTEGLTPQATAGRGLIRNTPPLEFQTALPELKVHRESHLSEEYEIISTEKIIDQFNKLLIGNLISKAIPIPVMKDKVNIFEINKKESQLAIGLGDKDLQPLCIDLLSNHVIMIAGDIMSGKSTILTSWIEAINIKVGQENVEVYAKDSNNMGIYHLMKQENVVDLDEIENMDDFVEKIKNELDNRRTQLSEAKRSNKDVKEIIASWKQIIFAIDNLNELTESDKYTLKDLLEQIAKKEYGMKVAIIAAGNLAELASNWDSLGKVIRQTQVGVLLGSIKEQSVFEVKYPYGLYEKEFSMCDGYLIVKNKYYGLRCATSIA